MNMYPPDPPREPEDWGVRRTGLRNPFLRSFLPPRLPERPCRQDSPRGDPSRQGGYSQQRAYGIQNSYGQHDRYNEEERYGPPGPAPKTPPRGGRDAYGQGGSPHSSVPQPRGRPLDPLQMRLEELNRILGPVQYGRPVEQTPRREGLRGKVRGLFSSGSIPRRKGKLVADREELLREIAQRDAARNEARARGEFVPDDAVRPHSLDPYYHQRR